MMIPDIPTSDDTGYTLPPKDKAKIEPLQAAGHDEAVEVMRQKIAGLYGNEPDVQEEAAEAVEASKHRSKHQQFMYRLSTSGKSLADIQTEWHHYYQDLPNQEKHEVWQEFYDAHKQARQAAQVPVDDLQTLVRPTISARRPSRNVQQLKDQLLGRLSNRRKLSFKHHLQSLLFGISMSAVVLLVLLFSFFNERFIAPFITPSRNVSSTPIIIDPNASVSIGADTKIIIPKINVEIPVVYDEPSIDEKAVQQALERGVVHYATSPAPGELGNAVIVGHSSNNILNHGRYKFAFVLLSRLEAGDTFMLTKNGKRYVYRVYEKRLVKPEDVSVLGSVDKPATVSLITCDPPGTSINRLVVTGEQIVPDVTANVASTVKPASAKPKIIPGNAPSLWQRLKDCLFS